MIFVQALIPVANASTEMLEQSMVESVGVAPYDPFGNMMNMWFWVVLLIIAPVVCFVVTKTRAKKMVFDGAFSTPRLFFRLLARLLVVTFLCSLVYITVDRLVYFFHEARSLAIDWYDVTYFFGRFYIIFSIGCLAAGAALLLYVKKNVMILKVAVPFILIFAASIGLGFISNL